MIKLLNSGFIELVDHMGNDASVVRSAKVSYASDKDVSLNDEEANKRLINYLYRNQHSSPFESVMFTFHVRCPIFVARQWMRHRTGKYNEISGRYTILPEDWFVPENGMIGKQHASNKQMSNYDYDDPRFDNCAIVDIDEACETSYEYYENLIELGVPRERARTVLPVGMYTRFYYTIDLHNLFHFITLRSHEHAQHEIQVYSNAMLELIEPIVPLSVAAFKRFKFVCIDTESEEVVKKE